MKAMILAAGRGERMRPLSDETPKPLLKVRGRPIIEWTIARLARAGIVELVVNHSHLGVLIETTLGDGRRFGVSLRYSPEKEALETAGGIANALPLLAPGPFIAVNGDILCDFDFATLRDRELGGDLAHLVLVPNPPHHPRGDFALRAGRIRDGEPPRLTFAGIGLYRAELFASLRAGEKAPLAPLLRAALSRGLISGEVHSGEWLDLGTPERLEAANYGAEDPARTNPSARG